MTKRTTERPHKASIVRGDNPIAVQRAAGHDDQATTLGYVRETVATPHFGAPFEALPMRLLDSVSVQDRQSHATGALKTAGIEASPAGFESERIQTSPAFPDSQGAYGKPIAAECDEKRPLPDSSADTCRARALLDGIAVCLREARHEDAAQLARRLAALLEQLATVGAALALLTAGLAATGGDHPPMAQNPYIPRGLHGFSLSLTTTSRERSFRPFDSFGRAKTGHQTPEGSPEGSTRSFGAQAPGRGGHR
jgi:hypothetical protein